MPSLPAAVDHRIPPPPSHPRATTMHMTAASIRLAITALSSCASPLVALLWSCLTLLACGSAQSPLTTTLGGTFNAGTSATLYFDLTVSGSGIVVTGLDLHLTGNGTVEVYTCPNSRLGNQLNPAAWTLVSTGATLTGSGGTVVVGITPFSLPPGSRGVALRTTGGTAHIFSLGNGSNQNYATAELSLAAGEVSSGAFSGSLASPWVVNARITYVGAAAAAATPIGFGCGQRFASVYESFATAAAFDLSFQSMSYVPNGPGYTVVPGQASFVAPSAAAINVAVGDDVAQLVPFTGTFPYLGFGVSSFGVYSNGYVATGLGNSTASVLPVATMLGASLTAWGCNHDFLPTGGANGNVKFEQIGSIVYVTWAAVRDFFGAGVSTWQMQFNLSNGVVTCVWQSMSLTGGSYLVFHSPGGAMSLDPGSTDLSVAIPTNIVLGPDVVPLTLSTTTRPILGTNWILQVSNIPTTGTIGLQIVGFSDPNLPDLGFLGALGCSSRATPDFVSPWVVNQAPTHPYGIVVPSTLSLTNLHVFTQAAVLVPGINTFLGGAITSNAFDGRLGNF